MEGKLKKYLKNYSSLNIGKQYKAKILLNHKNSKIYGIILPCLFSILSNL